MRAGWRGYIWYRVGLGFGIGLASGRRCATGWYGGQGSQVLAMSRDRLCCRNHSFGPPREVSAYNLGDEGFYEDDGAGLDEDY